MPGRNYVNSLNFPYAYQGQEKDAETNLLNFELRQYDARLGRWYNPDPYGQHHSPYLAMGNNPITMIDPDGGRDVNGGVNIDPTYGSDDEYAKAMFNHGGGDQQSFESWMSNFERQENDAIDISDYNHHRAKHKVGTKWGQWLDMQSARDFSWSKRFEENDAFKIDNPFNDVSSSWSEELLGNKSLNIIGKEIKAADIVKSNNVSDQIQNTLNAFVNSGDYISGSEFAIALDLYNPDKGKDNKMNNFFKELTSNIDRVTYGGKVETKDKSTHVFVISTKDKKTYTKSKFGMGVEIRNQAVISIVKENSKYYLMGGQNISLNNRSLPMIILNASGKGASLKLTGGASILNMFLKDLKPSKTLETQ